MDHSQEIASGRRGIKDNEIKKLDRSRMILVRVIILVDEFVESPYLSMR